MVDKRKTFIGYDYTLCEGIGCNKCNNCVRYLTHVKAIETNYNTLGVAYLVTPIDGDCECYVNAEKWMRRFDADNDEFDYGHDVKHNTIDWEE